MHAFERAAGNTSMNGLQSTMLPGMDFLVKVEQDTSNSQSEISFSTGILPLQQLEALIGQQIVVESKLDPDQIQPASVDLRLGNKAWRVRSSFLPGADSTVEGKLAQLDGVMHEIDLSDGAVLERGCVYIVPLQEALRLRASDNMTGMANPKSSSGRLDVFVRVMSDYAIEFDRIARGYRGPLYAEISPRTFSVLVRAGSRLCQLRLRSGSPVLGRERLRDLHKKHQLVDTEESEATLGSRSVAVTLDLKGEGANSIVGFRAKRHAGVVDVDRKNALDPSDYFEPIRSCDWIILDPGEFYVLATRERVTVPPEHSAEMIAYDTLVGEFRVHYAGFFDPGFGWSPDNSVGSRAVLEVRSHEVPFLLEHRQIMGRLCYERLTEVPASLYGASLGSHYQGQSLALSKHFKSWPAP